MCCRVEVRETADRFNCFSPEVDPRGDQGWSVAKLCLSLGHVAVPGPWTGVGLPPAGPGLGVSQSARGADRGQRQCPESLTAGRGAALGGVCEADDCFVSYCARLTISYFGNHG